MRIQNFSLRDVEMTEPFLLNAFEKEQEYLKSIDADRLLAGFRKTAGLDQKAEVYPGGWEDTEIAGHTMGHYLTALSQVIAATGAEDFSERLDYLLDELSCCQREDGYLFANEDTLFDKVERGEQVWVPWYTMHKVVAGLLSAYQFAKKPLALDIVTKLGSWIAKRTQSWTPEVHDKVLEMEYGGMNDCLYELYSITGQKDILKAAESFDEVKLFQEIAEGNDVLSGKHANTTIPKFLGAMNRYLCVGETETFYKRAAQSFFDIVLKNHTYITGGNSEWERFREPLTLGKERTSCNCETCNTYNMLKLSERLYAVTGEKRYMDFYEQTFYNAIFGSQNPQTGMTTYFQPMAAGYFKTFSRPFDNFWCCTGTGMENFTKLNSQIYHQRETGLSVDLYLASILHDRKLNIDLIQNTSLDAFDKVSMTVFSQNKKRFSLFCRIPEWTGEHFEVRLSGEKADYSMKGEYLCMDREWSGKETVELTFYPKVKVHPLPDLPESAAFTYGPFALAGGLPATDMVTDTTGVNVTVPTKRFPVRETITIYDKSVSEWFDSCEQNFVKKEDSLSFTINGTDADNEVVFSPYYRHFDDRYALYFDYVSVEKPTREKIEKKINQIREQLTSTNPAEDEKASETGEELTKKEEEKEEIITDCPVPKKKTVK